MQVEKGMKLFRGFRFCALALAAAAIPACGGNDGGSSSQVSAAIEPAPDFQLIDKNPHSKTHDKSVSPRDYLALVPGFYFTHANWGYCRSQFGFLDQLQKELLSENKHTKIRLLGINAVGFEADVPGMIEDRKLPLLQDTSTQNVWGRWTATWRDLMILNSENIHVDTYNLTAHDLANPTFYAELKARLKAAAEEP